MSFIDNFKGKVKGVEIVGDNNYLLNFEFLADVIIGIDNISNRQKIIKEIRDFKNLNFQSFIHPKVSFYDSDLIQIFKGCYIGEYSILTTDSNVEYFCFINSNVSIHHDSIIREYCVIMPGVRITGGAEIGKNTRLAPNVQISKKK